MRGISIWFPTNKCVWKLKHDAFNLGLTSLTGHACWLQLMLGNLDHNLVGQDGAYEDRFWISCNMGQHLECDKLQGFNLGVFNVRLLGCPKKEYPVEHTLRKISVYLSDALEKAAAQEYLKCTISQVNSQALPSPIRHAFLSPHQVAFLQELSLNPSED